MTGSVAAVVLAAGHSRRMGRPKPFLPFRETTFLGVLVENLHRAGVRCPIVVSNPAHTELYAANPIEGIHLVPNPRVDDGMLGSFRLGLQHVDPEVSHAVFCLVDMPEVGAETLKRFVRLCASQPGRIVVATHDGRWGHPVAFPRELFAALICWTGPEGARGFIEVHRQVVVEIESADPAVEIDVDTPEELERLRRRHNDFVQ